MSAPAVGATLAVALFPNELFFLIPTDDKYPMKMIGHNDIFVNMGILSTAVAVGVIGYIHDSKIAKAKTDIAVLESALDLYKMDAGVYPTTEQGLNALIAKPAISPFPNKWRETGYLKKPLIPEDPWGNKYEYLCPGINFHYDIISYGADGEPGGDGKGADIGSWIVE